MFLSNKIIEYIEQHSSDEDSVLYELRRETHLKAVYPQMISGPVQGKFLEFISYFLNPKFVLEVGTFTGYASICLAKGLQNHGELHTIEQNDELLAISDKYFKRSNLKHKIHQHIGDAYEIIPKLNYSFDLIFLDSEKRGYLKLFPLIKEKLNVGGFLLVDNVLWNGKVVHDNPDADTEAIIAFNKVLKADPTFDQVIIPLRDGISMARKISE